MPNRFAKDTDWLIADIGATSSRFAICSAAGLQYQHKRVYRNDDFASIAEIIEQYTDTLSASPIRAAFGIAAPVSGDDVHMINRNWRFNRNELANAVGFRELRIINDFHAVAWALPGIRDASRLEIGKSTHYRAGNIAVLGPGSGLGVSAWIQDGAMSAAMTGEGGHVTMAARNSSEDAIVQYFRDQYGHCSAERILCGPGLLDLHFAMHGMRLERPEDITSAPKDTYHAATLRQFFLFLGSVASDLALTTGALGGLYIAGGIVPANIELFDRSGFRERFEDKNRYREYMQSIPTWVITDPAPGLTGLAAYVRTLAGNDLINS